MDKFFIVCGLFTEIFGGGETLVIRMANWLSLKGFQAFLLLPEKKQLKEEYQEVLSDNKIRIIRIKKSGVKIFPLDPDCALLTSPQKYIIAVAFQKKQYSMLHQFLKKQRNCHLFFYSIYFGDSVLADGGNIFFFRWMMRMYLGTLLNNNAYVCMDSIMRDVVSNYAFIPKKRIPIARLGNDRSFATKHNEICKKRPFIILSVCRFDFPFKGYVLGLVRDFSAMASAYPDMELWLVGDGDGFDRCRSEINQLPQECRERIRMLGSLPYEKIFDLYYAASVYVGMGTTLLEATSCGVISIVANAYQEDNYSSGFFHETDCLGLPLMGNYARYIDTESARKHRFGELIEQVYKWDNCEYAYRCQQVHQFYQEKYSMEQMMEYFTDSENGKIPKRKLGFSFICTVFYIVFLIRNRW